MHCSTQSHVLRAVFSIAVLGISTLSFGMGSGGAKGKKEGASKPSPVQKGNSNSCCNDVWGMSDGSRHRTRGTGYYPANTAMEGGFVDRKGAPLRTLQSFIRGNADYVSVAMDAKILPYGAKICIPELNDRYGSDIKFKVVDTGGAFVGKGFSRADICTASNSASLDSAINSTFTLIVCK